LQNGMTHSIRHPLTLHVSRAVAAASAAAAAAAVHAAALNIDVTDANGVRLVDAVALLEPTSGKVPVKPMADVEISQAKRQFNPRVTLITVGTRAMFPNFDTVRHHVYSFSAIKTFELKLYAGVPSSPVVFDKPGVAVLGCNIHDNMAAWVVVADTPWSARSGTNGRARIESVPPGSYKLRMWHPGLGPDVEPAAIAVTIGAADLDQSVRLAVRAEP
jgi:plastocyanin